MLFVIEILAELMSPTMLFSSATAALGVSCIPERDIRWTAAIGWGLGLGMLWAWLSDNDRSIASMDDVATIAASSLGVVIVLVLIELWRRRPRSRDY